MIRTQVLVPLCFADGYNTTARVFSFDGLVDGQENLALGLGDRAAPLTSSRPGRIPLVRPHSECLTGDVFGSRRCDCGAQLREAVERIADSGGYLLYLRQEGRGIGLYAKLEAYALQDTGLDTYEANLALGHREDERSYLVAAQMLKALGVTEIALLSNNPDKALQLRRFGVNVVARVPTGVYLSDANARYLATKAARGAHTLDLPLSAGRDQDRARRGRTSRSV
jgi:GTP cyclohydrolase II